MSTNADIIKVMGKYNKQMVGVVKDYTDSIHKLGEIEQNFKHSPRSVFFRCLPTIIQFVTIFVALGFLFFFAGNLPCGFNMKLPASIEISRSCQ